MTEMIDLIYFIDDIFKLNKPKVSKVILNLFYFSEKILGNALLSYAVLPKIIGSICSLSIDEVF